MFFLKKVLLGIGALCLIFLGGAGTQTENTLLQGGGFLGLIIGLVVLYIFAKMAWRAMGCLPSVFLILAIIVFILYAIGGFKGGIGNIGNNLRSFLGQQEETTPQASARIALIETEKLDTPISESFSSPAAAVSRQTPSPQENSGGMLDKLFGGGESSGSSTADIRNLPVIYSSARVISGDTLDLNGHVFHLFGIDAPEINQTCADSRGQSYSCGRQAAAWLSGWLQENPLECRVMQEDPNGIMVGTCSLGAYDLGAALVNAGWAVAYLQSTDIYVPYQIQAQENRNGLWQGEFYMPWDWRKLQNRKPDIKIIRTKPKRKRTLLNPMG